MTQSPAQPDATSKVPSQAASPEQEGNGASSSDRAALKGHDGAVTCLAFSRDGKTMGIDVDGPANDKGLYALVPLKRISTISNDYLLRWSSFSEEHSQKRFGFMSQVSPDGKYVVNSIDVPHAHGTRVLDRLYNGFYENYGFGQVFYPTRGVLAWYSKETGKLQPLTGADDPNLGTQFGCQRSGQSPRVIRAA